MWVLAAVRGGPPNMKNYWTGRKDSGRYLRGSADRSQPADQEKVVAAKSAAIRPQDPVDRLLHGVPYADASKINRSAMRTAHGKHSFASFLPVSFRRAAGTLHVGAPDWR